jgi:hypothetical protein
VCVSHVVTYCHMLSQYAPSILDPHKWCRLSYDVVVLNLSDDVQYSRRAAPNALVKSFCMFSLYSYLCNSIFVSENAANSACRARSLSVTVISDAMSQNGMSPFTFPPMIHHVSPVSIGAGTLP